MTDLATFQEKFRVSALKISENADWNWSLRPTQPTLGASVVSFKREAAALSDLGATESASLVEMLSACQATLSRTFGCDKINILLLMHFDSHLHFHLVPRYKSPVQAFDIEWNDTGWPGFPDKMNPGEGAVSDVVIEQVRASLAE